jgi:hypothetical protein
MFEQRSVREAVCLQTARRRNTTVIEIKAEFRECIGCGRFFHIGEDFFQALD